MNTNPSSAASPADQRDLLARIAQGDQRALRAAYNDHAGMAMAVALRVLGSRTEAEAVVQDTFVEVWRHAREEEARGSGLATWIAGIARRRAKERLGTRPPVPEEVPVLVDDSAQPLPLESATRRRERRRVAAVLSRLPADQRSVVEMAWFSCLSLAEIAVRTSEPVHVIQTRLRAGMERLAVLLQQAPEKSA